MLEEQSIESMLCIKVSTFEMEGDTPKGFKITLKNALLQTDEFLKHSGCIPILNGRP